MTLEIPNATPETVAVGLRMKQIRPGHGDNACLCRVVEEIENPFSYTILLEPAENPGPVPLGWELSKPQWEDLRTEQLEIQIPGTALLPLRDDK